jgi:hypothetical protein
MLAIRRCGWHVVSESQRIQSPSQPKAIFGYKNVEGLISPLNLSLHICVLQGLVFFLGRECPREQLTVVIRSFGGEAAWDGEGSPCGEADERITHQVR